jgi:hypothetical protein
MTPANTTKISVQRIKANSQYKETTCPISMHVASTAYCNVNIKNMFISLSYNFHTLRGEVSILSRMKTNTHTMRNVDEENGKKRHDEVEQLDVRGRNENSLVAIGGNHLN